MIAHLKKTILNGIKTDRIFHENDDYDKINQFA